MRTDPTGHNWWSSVTSAVSAVAQVALPVAGQVLDATTAIPLMIHDLQTIVNGDNSSADRWKAAGDLLLNLAMDATYLTGTGEGARVTYIGAHAAEHLVEEDAGRTVAHAGEDALAHEGERATQAETRRLARQQGEKTYQTYTKENRRTEEVYSGRTSGCGTPEKNLARRDRNHHRGPEDGCGPARLDKSSSSHDAIRGRKQMLIEHYRRIGRGTPQINGISPSNVFIDRYMEAALQEFGRIR